MTVFWDLIWDVLMGMFVANLLTVDAITPSQLEGMEEDNPADAADAPHANLSPEEEALIRCCGKTLMLFRLRNPLEFWGRQRNQCADGVDPEQQGADP